MTIMNLCLRECNENESVLRNAPTRYFHIICVAMVIPQKGKLNTYMNILIRIHFNLQFYGHNNRPYLDTCQYKSLNHNIW